MHRVAGDVSLSRSGSPTNSLQSDDGDGPINGSTPSRQGGRRLGDSSGGKSRQQGRRYSRSNSSDSEGGNGGDGGTLRKPLIKPTGESRFAVDPLAGAGAGAAAKGGGGGGGGRVFSEGRGVTNGRKGESLVSRNLMEDEGYAAVKAIARYPLAEFDDAGYGGSEETSSIASASDTAASPSHEEAASAYAKRVSDGDSDVVATAVDSYLQIEVAESTAPVARADSYEKMLLNDGVCGGDASVVSGSTVARSDAAAKVQERKQEHCVSTGTGEHARRGTTPPVRPGSGRKLPQSPLQRVADASSARPAARRRGHARAHSTGHKIDLSTVTLKTIPTPINKQSLSALTPPREGSPIVVTQPAASGAGNAGNGDVDITSVERSHPAASRGKRRSLSDIGPAENIFNALANAANGRSGAGVLDELSPTSGLSAAQKRILGHRRTSSWGNPPVLDHASFVEVTAC